jgi:hypothetical protein
MRNLVISTHHILLEHSSKELAGYVASTVGLEKLYSGIVR